MNNQEIQELKEWLYGKYNNERLELLTDELEYTHSYINYYSSKLDEITKEIDTYYINKLKGVSIDLLEYRVLLITQDYHKARLALVNLDRSIIQDIIRLKKSLKEHLENE